MHDLLLQNYVLDMGHPYLKPYTSIGALAAFLAIGYRKYVGRHPWGGSGQRRAGAAPVRARSRAGRQLPATEHHGAPATLHAERRCLIQEMHDGIGSSLLSALRMA